MDALCAPGKLALIGTGYMGTEYGRVLIHLGYDESTLTVIGRGEPRSKTFRERFGICVTSGGIDALAGEVENAIVAVDHENLFPVACSLMARGCKRMLLEKPGAATLVQLRQLDELAKDQGAMVYVAFNRRFLPSVLRAQALIDEDGGLLSCSFDFTEMESRVIADPTHSHPVKVLERWGVFNSSHVMDLFLMLAGAPLEFKYYRGGSLSWHPSAATFAGAGVTDKGAYFSYLATWGGAGRWGLELTTTRRKLILRPLEQLLCQRAGQFGLEELELDTEPEGLKPGLWGQVSAFLGMTTGNGSHVGRLCPLSEAILHYRACEEILGY